MNRGVLQSSPMQQMMAGNPNWWSMKPPTPQSSPFLLPPANILFPQYPSCYENQEHPESLSHLLMGPMVDEEDKSGVVSHFQKKENPANSYFYGHENEDLQAAATTKPIWSQVMPPASSPKSCVTSFSSSNKLDFTSRMVDAGHPPPDRSSECNSTASGGATKKARVQSSSSTFKVRKEKLGDRITALHQLVSPFGKTDTASVLLEAIEYIRFLQSQIEALSLPYLGSRLTNMRQRQHSHSDQGERNCIFPEDPGQESSHEEPKKDLRSRGLCLVPVSCTMQVGSDNGADYWALALGGGGFR